MARLKDDPIGRSAMPKYGGTSPAFKAPPTQITPATMPKFNGAPQGGFYSQVMAPFSKARSGMTTGLNQIMRNSMSQSPEESHARQLNKLVSENIYTPEAEFAMYNVPQVVDQNTPGRMAYNDRANNILYQPNYWETTRSEDPAARVEDLRHEFGHYFDRGGQRSSNPEFMAAAKQTDAEFFPGAYPGGKSTSETGGWGSPIEMYADVGRNPYWFRQLSKWYPQYNAQAYNMPAFAGKPGNWTNENRTWQFKPTAGRGPYTDIANRDPNKVITMPAPAPIYQAAR